MFDHRVLVSSHSGLIKYTVPVIAPYWGAEADYGRDAFTRADFARLAEILQDLAGGFILSINDVPEIRDLFAWAEIRQVETTYTIAPGDGAPAAELIIMGGALQRHEAPRLL